MMFDLVSYDKFGLEPLLAIETLACMSGNCLGWTKPRFQSAIRAEITLEDAKAFN